MPEPAGVGGVVVVSLGEVLAPSREQVRERVARFVDRRCGGGDLARVKLTVVRRRSLGWAALAQANIELRGEPVRAQVGARFFAEAGRLLVARLEEHLLRLVDPGRARSWPPRRPRPQPVDLRPADRRITRTKTYQLVRCDPDRAALSMDVGDYDFYLFSDADTGQDAVIYRVGPTGYRLARLGGLMPPAPRTTLPLTVNVHRVPVCAPGEVAAHLAATEWPFQFFGHSGTGRGAVLYRRYDGHYGLLTPAEPASEESGARGTEEGGQSW